MDDIPLDQKGPIDPTFLAQKIFPPKPPPPVKKVIKNLAVLILIAAVPLTVFLAGQTQTARQHASSSTSGFEVVYFDGNSCPSGWTEMQGAEGRYVVGLNQGGTLDATVGTSLSDKEDRPTGQHSHAISSTTISSLPPSSSKFLIDDNRDGWPVDRHEGDGEIDPKSAPLSSILSVDDAGLVAGTNAPYVQLLACGKPASDPSAANLPPNSIVFLDSTTVPSGWSEFVPARGRYIVGLVPGGTLDGTDGQALADKENRPTGKHNHTITASTNSNFIVDPGDTWFVDRNENYCSGSTGGCPSLLHISSIALDSSGSVDGTNAPYIQLMAIKNTSSSDQTIPQNAVLYYEGTTAPSGFSEFTQARGLYIVGLNPGGTLDGNAMTTTDEHPLSQTALLDVENRATGKHTHTVSSTSDVSFLLDDGRDGYPLDRNENYCSGSTGGCPSTYAISNLAVSTFGAVAGTNAPYIQLLAIKYAGAAPSPANTPTPTPVPTQGASSINFSVTLGGIGGNGENKNPLHTTRNATVCVYDLTTSTSGDNDCSHALVKTTGTVTYNSTTGTFDATNFNLGVVPGEANSQYTLLVKVENYLRKRLGNVTTLTLGGNTHITSTTPYLSPGDITQHCTTTSPQTCAQGQDNIVDTPDFNGLLSCYHAVGGTKLYGTSHCPFNATTNNPGADLNDDGDVDHIDYNLFVITLGNKLGD